MNFKKFRERSRSIKDSVNLVTSAEKWRNYGKNSTRTGSKYFDDSSDDDDDQRDNSDDNDDGEPNINVEEMFSYENANESDEDTEVQLTSKQTLLLATMVPDELLLLEKFDFKEPKRFVGVLLMADVSGYTALSERYCNSGEGGTYRLTVTLNSYIGSLTELIYRHGGDVIKFAGDAFLALWKTDKRTFLCHTIHNVIACALIMQHCYGSYETDAKVNLKVKLAISAGNLIFSSIGDGTDMNYVIVGLPVKEAKKAESLCSSGDVRLTPTAWGHCYSRNYVHVIHEDGHVTIKTILYDPREKDVSKPFHGFGPMISYTNKAFNGIEDLPDTLWETNKNSEQPITEILKQHETLSIRKTILLSEEKNVGPEIRKFMIRPVLTQIDGHQPLEYLTEMREVSVMFMTLKPKDCPYLQLLTIVSNAYQITREIVYKSMGCVNKIILFDKDIMILVIFGLRGFKHESEAQAALKCSYVIKKNLAALHGVTEVSIGITTGQVYCGVVGHPLRREFTIIGAVVNKAARLMCCYQDKITCDESTFIKSRLSKFGFTLQPKIDLKGIKHPGNIYEYSEEIRTREINNIPTIQTLLDRNNEMCYFEEWLQVYDSKNRLFGALLFLGDSGVGKTRLLEWMARHARTLEDYNVCYINLTCIHTATPYLALTQIVNQLLNIKEPIIGFSKEEKIVELLQVYDEDLCYLNNIIKVRFAYHEGVYSQDEQHQKNKAKILLKRLLNCLSESYVILLDDLQNLDSSSWEYISIVLSIPKIFTILSVTRTKFNITQDWLYSVFTNSSIRKIILKPLENNFIPALACQILNVNGVAGDLCEALKNKCKGKPGNIENFILHLFSKGALEIKKVLDNELNEWIQEESLQLPDSILLHPQAFDPKDQIILDQIISEELTSEKYICVVKRKEDLKNNINTQNLATLIMIQIDTLTPYQQLLLKIASVIGNILSRDLLENIMYENNQVTTAKAIKRLFGMQLLTCANVPIVKGDWNKALSTVSVLSTMSKRDKVILTCDCDFDYDHENEVLPKYAFCKIMRFVSRKSQKTFYELLPTNQKKEFHSRIINYLENNKQKCRNCGGKILVVNSNTNLNALSDIVSSTNFKKIHSNDSVTATKSLINNSIRLGNVKFSSINKVKSESSINVTLSEYRNSQEKSNESLERDTSMKKTRFCNVIMSKLIRSFKKVSSTPILVRMSKFKLEKLTAFVTNRVFENFREVIEADDINKWHSIDVVDSQDILDSFKASNREMSISVKINKGVSQTNFEICACAKLNVTIYEQLIYHAKLAELTIKTIKFLICYSRACLLCDDVNDALEKLDEAENSIIEDQSNNNVSVFDKKRFLGKIYALRAASQIMCGNIITAKQNMQRALSIYHINLLTIRRLLKIKNTIPKLTRGKYKIQKEIMLRDSVYCLNIATLLYSSLGNDKLAWSSSQYAISSLNQIQCNITDICDTLANALHIEIVRGNLEAVIETERKACNILKKIPRPIQAEELPALGRFCMAVFRARIARARLAASIRSGYKAFVISRFLHVINISLDIIPDLFYLLLARGRIGEAVAVVKEILNLNHNRRCLERETWYYALCIDMILDCGLQIESPDEITRFALHKSIKTKATMSSQRRLIVGLWTYWLRVEPEGKAKLFESDALRWTNYEDDDGTTTALLSGMRLAEGMITSLATKMDDLRKVVDLMELRSIADRELTRLERDVQMCRTIYPRWILMKANSLRISGRNNAALTAFEQALEISRRIHNKLEEALALAATSKRNKSWMQMARKSNFIDCLNIPEHICSSWHKILYKITTNKNSLSEDLNSSL